MRLAVLKHGQLSRRLGAFHFGAFLAFTHFLEGSVSYPLKKIHRWTLLKANFRAVKKPKARAFVAGLLTPKIAIFQTKDDTFQRRSKLKSLHFSDVPSRSVFSASSRNQHLGNENAHTKFHCAIPGYISQGCLSLARKECQFWCTSQKVRSKPAKKGSGLKLVTKTDAF